MTLPQPLLTVLRGVRRRIFRDLTTLSDGGVYLESSGRMKTDDVPAAPVRHNLKSSSRIGVQHFNIFLLALIFLTALPVLAQAKNQQPVSLVSMTPLPGFVGDFDHFAVDLKR